MMAAKPSSPATSLRNCLRPPNITPLTLAASGFGPTSTSLPSRRGSGAAGPFRFRSRDIARNSIADPEGHHSCSCQTRNGMISSIGAFCPLGIWEKIIPMRCLGRVALLLLLAASAASAQLKETIDVHLVEVPVTVVDRAGDPVRGLTAANFEVLDQGKKREIKSFDKIDFNSAETMKSTSSLNPNARRSFLLLFDLSFSAPLGRIKAEEAARNFIARGMQRRDLAAIATVDINHGFRMVTAFTTDKTLLAAAVASPQTFVATDPLQIAGSTVFEVTQDKVAQSEQSGRGAEYVAFARDIAIQEKRLHDTYDRTRVERQLLLLTDLAKTLRQLPGRKQVMFFSEGFDPRLVQGRDARDTEGTADEMAETMAGNLWRVDTDARYGSSTSMAILNQMAQAFRGSDIVLNSVDIQGVRVQNNVTDGSV